MRAQIAAFGTQIAFFITQITVSLAKSRGGQYGRLEWLVGRCVSSSLRKRKRELGSLAISATGFTVLGIVNMLLTMVINLIVWDKHSSFIGTIGLLICMFGGVMYQQSTSNKPKPKPADVNEVKAEEEQQKLLEMQRLVN
ncbi:GDP-mannose transporter GONST3-like protein [Tanacetum coccineum]|uniref:GDP-mannose transporter GONST3-like protein n=1 Tax=Tanacetum coccineum TaxID=301880 RepID=A0ABQ5AT31_9ASTR